MDRIARIILPPPKPVGLAFRGYQITLLDLALVAYPTAGALALWAWTGNWLWLPATAFCMALAAFWWAR
jgi:hypothetical protein